MSNPNPKIKSHVTIIGHTPDQVELRFGVWNPVSHILNDDQGSRKLYRIISCIRGDYTIGEIAKKADVSRSVVEDIITQLTILGVITNGPESVIDFYLQNCIPTLQPKLIKKTKVKIVGSRDLSEMILSNLNLTEYFDEAGILPAETYEFLKQSAQSQSWEKDSLGFEEILERCEDWKEYFIIVASNQIDPFLMQAINRICFGLDLSFITVTIDGPFLFIGPTVIPHKTACWECLETRVMMNLRNSAAYLNYKNALTSGNVDVPDFYPGKIIQSLISTHASMEILNFALTGTTFTVNKILSIYLPTMEIVFHEIFKVSSCKSCYPSKISRNKELYFNLSSLLNS